MPVALVAVIAVAAVLVIVLLALLAERFRRNRRFARKLSPYERRRPPGGGQILDPDDWRKG